MNAADVTQNQDHAPATKIAGYSQPTPEMIEMVNKFKKAEADLGKLYREAEKSGLADGRMLSVGKTNAQIAFMWMNRSIFKPKDVFAEE